jgi:uncharacterized protein YecE (DUF72 family)
MSQIDLFGGPSKPASDPTIDPAKTGDAVTQLAAPLPDRLRLGTSSWSFPGWAGIVYDREYPAARLSRDGLAAYGQHPLLRTVGVDSSFYNPVSADRWQHWAEQVPDDFRFLVKGARQVTSPWQWDAKGRMSGANPHFLSADFALERIIEPLLEGIGDKLGTLLWQFPPLGRDITANPRRFAEDLYRFLNKLPVGPGYSVELRDAGLLTHDFVQALHHGGAVPALSVHPRLPELKEQRARFEPLQQGPLVIRWMLRRDRRYEEAKADFSPFDSLQAEDPDSRTQITVACRDALAQGRDVYVVANNKAEGSSPLSLARLASALLDL